MLRLSETHCSIYWELVCNLYTIVFHPQSSSQALDRKVKTVLYVGLGIEKPICTAKTKQSEQQLETYNGAEKCFTYPKIDAKIP